MKASFFAVLFAVLLSLSCSPRLANTTYIPLDGNIGFGTVGADNEFVYIVGIISFAAAHHVLQQQRKGRANQASTARFRIHHLRAWPVLCQALSTNGCQDFLEACKDTQGETWPRRVVLHERQKTSENSPKRSHQSVNQGCGGTSIHVWWRS